MSMSAPLRTPPQPRVSQNLIASSLQTTQDSHRNIIRQSPLLLRGLGSHLSQLRVNQVSRFWALLNQVSRHPEDHANRAWNQEAMRHCRV